MPTATRPPAPGATARPAPLRRYTVRKGDTLFRIARRCGLTTAALASFNGIHDLSKIRVGQVLRIPPAAR